jgi:hypothetical protein
MPLYRHTKLPPVPELGEKTFWDYFPRRSARRIVFLIIALGAIVVLKYSGSWTFGGLLDSPKSTGGAEPAGPVYHIKVTRPDGTVMPPGGNVMRPDGNVVRPGGLSGKSTP